MKRTNWVTRFPLGIVALVLFVFAVYISAKKDPRNELLYVFENFRGKIFVYHQLNRRFAVLKSAEFDFWDLKKTSIFGKLPLQAAPTPRKPTVTETTPGSHSMGVDLFQPTNFFGRIFSIQLPANLIGLQRMQAGLSIHPPCRIRFS